MSVTRAKENSVGLIIGRERDWPEAFAERIQHKAPGMTAELIKLSGTFSDDECVYPVIVDRMSHEIPYYRTYVKYAALNGAYVINNPFVWSADNRFFGTAVAARLKLKSPRTIVLPNKDTFAETVPDSFRNLEYPMDWQGITDLIGVPAIFKEIHSGGRRLSYRVNSVEELIQHYDESGTHTMILQELIQGGEHIHCLVVGGDQALVLHYEPERSRYLPSPQLDEETLDRIIHDALALSHAYGYDINLIEFNCKEGELVVINSTNPSPIFDRRLFEDAQFDWIIEKTAKLAVERVKNSPPQIIPFQLSAND